MSTTNTNNEAAVGRLAVAQGVITPTQLQQCLTEQRLAQTASGTAMPLGALLVKHGFASESQLLTLVAQATAVPVSGGNGAAAVKPAGGNGAAAVKPAGGNGAAKPKAAQQIPGYQILGKLGAGAMGAVYKARQISLGRTVAIKILPPRVASNQNFLERFYREARSAGKLNHENVVGALDVGEAGGLHYFVMEYVDGESVRDRLGKGPLDERTALGIAKQVAKALAHASKNGIVHRDVKPDNIMLTRDGVAKLCDLGLAKQTATDPTLTTHGAAVGTPWYIAPEQARGELQVDVRADIYSLGATLFHICAGGPPFIGPTAAVIMTKHLNEPVPDPRRSKPQLSRGFAELVMWMMAKSPADRPQNAQALITAIERVERGARPRGGPVPTLGAAPVAAAPAGPRAARRGGRPLRPSGRSAPPAPGRAPRARRDREPRELPAKSPVGLIVGILVVAVVGLGGVLVATSGDDAPPPASTRESRPTPKPAPAPVVKPPEAPAPAPVVVPERDVLKDRLIERIQAQYDAANDLATASEYQPAIAGFEGILKDPQYNEFASKYTELARYLKLARDGRARTIANANTAATRLVKAIEKRIADDEYLDVARPQYGMAWDIWGEFPEALKFTGAWEARGPAALDALDARSEKYYGALKAKADELVADKKYAQAKLALSKDKSRLTPKWQAVLDGAIVAFDLELARYREAMASFKEHARGEYQALATNIQKLLDDAEYQEARAALEAALGEPKYIADGDVEMDIARDLGLVQSLQLIYESALVTLTKFKRGDKPIEIRARVRATVEAIAKTTEALKCLPGSDYKITFGRSGSGQQISKFSTLTAEELINLADPSLYGGDVAERDGILAEVSFWAYRAELEDWVSMVRADQLRVEADGGKVHPWAAARIAAVLELVAPKLYEAVKKNYDRFIKRASDRYRKPALAGIGELLALYKQTKYLTENDAARLKELTAWKAKLEEKSVPKANLKLFHAPYKLRKNKLEIEYKFDNAEEIEDFPPGWNNGGKTKVANSELQLRPDTDQNALGDLLRQGGGRAGLGPFFVSRRWIGVVAGEFEMTIKGRYEQPIRWFGGAGHSAFRSGPIGAYGAPLKLGVETPAYSDKLNPGIYNGPADLRNKPKPIGSVGSVALSGGQKLTISLARKKSGRFTYRVNGKSVTNGSDAVRQRGWLEFWAYAALYKIDSLKLKVTLDDAWLKQHQAEVAEGGGFSESPDSLPPDQGGDLPAPSAGDPPPDNPGRNPGRNPGGGGFNPGRNPGGGGFNPGRIPGGGGGRWGGRGGRGGRGRR